jgi:hypothetical protein
VSNGPAYPRFYPRAPPARPSRAEEMESRRSNAAIPVVVVLLILGLYLGQYSLFIPGALGLVLLYAGGSFLSTRLNPISPHFYLPKKPSWLAVGVVFLGAIVLLWDTYLLLARELGSVVPHL